MTTTPWQARLALMGFLAIMVGIACNALYLQDRSATASSERTKAERALKRSEAERRRRLALDVLPQALPVAAPTAPGLSHAKPAAELPPVTSRVGRFAPSSGRADAVLAPLPEPDRSRETVREIQQRLTALGYAPGATDGVSGLLTRAAVMAYEHDQGLPMTADPSTDLLRHMTHGAQPGYGVRLTGSGPRHAEQVLRTVQQSLASLGYFPGKVDGRPGDETARAIREFEMDKGLVPSGRVSAPLLNRLAASTSTRKPGAH